MTSAARGISLVEVLVAVTLFGMVMTMVVTLIVPTVHATTRGSAQVEMQQQALILYDRLRDDLAVTVPSAISVSGDNTSGNGPFKLGLQRIVDISANLRTKEWETTLETYSWDPATQDVRRVLWTSGKPPDLGLLLDGTHLVQLSGGQLNQIANADPPLPCQVMARGVTRLALVISPPPVTLTLTMERRGNTGKSTPETWQWTTSIPMRNVAP